MGAQRLIEQATGRVTGEQRRARDFLGADGGQSALLELCSARTFFAMRNDATPAGIPQ
jgi:hypothetical protein